LAKALVALSWLIMFLGQLEGLSSLELHGTARYGVKNSLYDNMILEGATVRVSANPRGSGPVWHTAI